MSLKVTLLLPHQRLEVLADTTLWLEAVVDGQVLLYALHLSSDGLILEEQDARAPDLDSNVTILSREWGEHAYWEETDNA